MKSPLPLAVLLCLLPAVAPAGDDRLPGVEGDYRIVSPAPEPEPAGEPANRDDDGVIRAGEWDIRISGSVSFEIGTGSSAHRR